MVVRVQAAAFDPAQELAGFSRSAVGAGAIVSFTGIVRDLPGGGLQRLELEHYPGMTERAIVAMVAEARERWHLSDALVLHRFGTFSVGEPIMLLATAAAHRGDAFRAAEFLMDSLKSRAPFWKREVSAQGAHWVQPRAADEDALRRWQGACSE